MIVQQLFTNPNIKNDLLCVEFIDLNSCNPSIVQELCDSLALEETAPYLSEKSRVGVISLEGGMGYTSRKPLAIAASS